MNLLAVNVFVGCLSAYQLKRKWECDSRATPAKFVRHCCCFIDELCGRYEMSKK
jgi:hypothetical protein